MNWLLTSWLACGGGPVASGVLDAEPGPVEVRVMLDGAPRSGGGDLVVQVEYDPAGRLQLPEPVAPGLEFALNGDATREDLGVREVVTQRFIYKGPRGNYEITPLTAVWTGTDDAGEPLTVEASSTSIFLDIEADPIVAGELADIEDPSIVWRVPWVPIVSVGLLMVTGLGVAFWPRRRREEEAVVEVPPHLAAIEAWDAIRHRADLSDEHKARELSVIFRQYVEGVFRFEASAWTTSEILEKLRGLQALAEGNVPRAKRLLRATDRIKFAEERPSGELIEELDADLRAFVDATRPRVWGQE